MYEGSFWNFYFLKFSTISFLHEVTFNLLPFLKFNGKIKYFSLILHHWYSTVFVEWLNACSFIYQKIVLKLKIKNNVGNKLVLLCVCVLKITWSTEQHLRKLLEDVLQQTKDIGQNEERKAMGGKKLWLQLLRAIKGSPRLPVCIRPKR